MDLDVLSIAQGYVDHNFPGRQVVTPVLQDFDEKFCRAVGEWFDRSRVDPGDPAVGRRYDQFKQETRAQYEAILAAGIQVRPWVGRDRPQPYATSAQLRAAVHATGTLFVYLTANGHGPGPGHGADHPMREPAGVEVAGVPFCYNDLFRAVHDLFGHVLHGHSFAARGEFKATYDHLQMYSTAVWPVLAGETVGQICWFFYGPHLTGCDDPPPAQRPYPEQKPLPFPEHYLSRYLSLFR